MSDDLKPGKSDSLIQVLADHFSEEILPFTFQFFHNHKFPPPKIGKLFYHQIKWQHIDCTSVLSTIRGTVSRLDLRQNLLANSLALFAPSWNRQIGCSFFCRALKRCRWLMNENYSSKKSEVGFDRLNELSTSTLLKYETQKITMELRSLIQQQPFNFPPRRRKKTMH